MCGRFTLQISSEMLAEIFGLIEIPTFPARYNIAPTQQIAIVRSYANHQNRLDFVRWGLIPSWAKDKSVGNHMINARAETVHEKPAFRHAIRYRRCLIPSSAFYEWRKEGERRIPLYIRLKDGSPMVFAGLWETWKSPEGENLESCAILTTTANKLIEPIHDRMPVILHPQEYDHWLDRDMTDPTRLQSLYQPYNESGFRKYS
ncbi:SOS response-associated peptidase [Geobacter sulfurreducens subsp. ethanolicus]|uniref:SOS response-associated peptidase n=1 Tax=Geobacter sulfurreducens TaxID=35554 RepID=UPI0025739970|nr:SOS response-associated peptidase [Geobacter sulfurreducens]BEH09837.1 SOS response-associated peptidase [Geobacter sulfurreducens subsp. ethanolicus]